MECSYIALGMKNSVNILESCLKFLPKLNMYMTFDSAILSLYLSIYLHFLKNRKKLTYGNNRSQNIDYLWWWKLFTKKWAQRIFPGEIFATFQIKILYLGLGGFCVGVFKRKYSLNTQLGFENFATCKFYLN